MLTTIKGMTALVTGASSGIGMGIARQMAAEGMHLLLVARSRAALEALASELSQQHGVRAVALDADLSQPGCGDTLPAAVSALNMRVDVLVNCAGFGTYGPFEKIDPIQERNEVAVNVSAVVELTHAFLSGMLARGQGAILNVASTAAFQPLPYMAVYGATKAFVLSFSEALWAEYRERGVHVAALCPGPVDTAFFGVLGDESIRATPVFAKAISAEQVAREAMRMLRGTAPTRIVGLKNRIAAMMPRLSPRSAVARIGAKLLLPPWLKQQGGAKSLRVRGST